MLGVIVSGLTTIFFSHPETNVSGPKTIVSDADTNQIIVLCAKGYPSDYVKDSEIKNLPKIMIDKNIKIFHAGTYKKNNKTYSCGGRVLNITSLSKSFIEARNKSLSTLKKINWTDGFYRKDIGWRAINNK